MAEDEFGDFEEIVDESKPENEENQEQQGFSRVREPYKGQYIGIIVQRLGGNRMEVKSTDGKTRNCRVPGKYKRKLWLRPKDVVMIEPWKDNDDKADVIYKYPPNAVFQLRKKGILSSIEQDF